MRRQLHEGGVNPLARLGVEGASAVPDWARCGQPPKGTSSSIKARRRTTLR